MSNPNPNSDIHREKAKRYIKERLEGIELDISQKLYYPMLIDYISVKVYHSNIVPNLSIYDDLLLKYKDYFPEFLI